MESTTRRVFFKALFTAAVILGQPHVSSGYKPVIIIHGILDSASDLSDLTGYIEQFHSGTVVHAIDLFDHADSFTPMWTQVHTIRNVTSSIMASAEDGVHIIGYSQGGLVARGIIQTSDNHNVDTFIALSSPLNGQYGDTSYLRWLFPNLVKEELYKVFYTTLGQRWSIPNYWKDPHHIRDYKYYSGFLAHINNESVPEMSKFKDSWRTNFERLKSLVLVGGPADDVITPWQSAQFGFFDENEDVKPMRELQIYRENSFGLRSLDKGNALMECTVPGITHLKWHKDLSVFHKCIEPFLT